MAISASTLELVAARADEGRRNRRIADDVVNAVIGEGLIRHFTPAVHGGLEGKPQDFFLDQIAIAEADMSTAWALGIIAVHNYQIALMDPRAQAEVWAQGPDAMVSSSYNPVGARAEAVAGGVML